MQSLAETLYNEGYLIYYESCGLESIGNAIQRYAALNILKKKHTENVLYG